MNTKTILTTFAGGVAAAALLAAAPASAATVTFADGPAHSPTAGFTVINNFDTLAGITCNVANLCQIKIDPSDPNGAPPANSNPLLTHYLSVLGGGVASYTFGSAVTGFEFDWGSVDSYNTLTVFGSSGPIVITGTNITNPANGDQHAPGTNGLFKIVGGVGETFTGVTFASSTNSFEVDNLATADVINRTGGVPEPATWAMMITGFGLAGGMMRAKRRVAPTA